MRSQLSTGTVLATHPAFSPTRFYPEKSTKGVRSKRYEGSYLFLLGWGTGWAAVGSLVAASIVFTSEGLNLRPVLVLSLLFAEMVGFTSLISSRMIFPHFAYFPGAARIALQVLTVFSGTVFGSGVILAAQPLLGLARIRTAVMIVLVNAVLGTITGIALYIYDSLRRQLEKSRRSLLGKEAMERELETAREVQRELLPRTFSPVSGLQVAGVCLPSVGVGGDFFDFIPLAEKRVGLVIADVSGKGVPAALLMAGLQASVRSFALPSLTPRDVNHRLNEMLCRSTSDSRYATLFFAFYDGRRRVLTYSNAGHFPPVLLGEDGPVRLEKGGTPIGLVPNADYGEGERDLASGDLLVLCTDGIIEAPGEEGEEFGDQRLLEILMRHRERDLEDLLHLVLDKLKAWSGGPIQDDVTLALARVA